MSTIQQEELSYFLWKIQLVQFEWNELPLEQRRADDETTEVLKASRGSEVVAARLHCRQTEIQASQASLFCLIHIVIFIILLYAPRLN